VWRGLLQRSGFRPEFDELFARGIDPVGVDRCEPDRAGQWPEPAEVLRYRDRVRDMLRRSTEYVSQLAERDVLAENGRVLQLVIEHELMHHETLLYMMHQLEPALLRPPTQRPPLDTSIAAPASRVAVPGGEVRLGARWDELPFGWDNEFSEHSAEVGSFAIDTAAVRIGDWLGFMGDGAYRRAELWSEDGWAWRQRNDIEHPAFWKWDGARWAVRALFDEVTADDAASWPVYVSWAEAEAYARWKNGRLPTEAEYHRAAEGLSWSANDGNLDWRRWAPVASGSGAASRHGVRDLVGNGWEWTSSRFTPFPGFKPWARTYPGYSADFFDGQHYVMLGGSWATDGSLVRRSFRNWFQPHYPYVYAKFRVVTT